MGSSLRDLINLVNLSITQAVVDRSPVIQRLDRTRAATLRHRHFNDADDQALVGREFAADHLFQGAAVRIVQRCDIDFQVSFHTPILPRVAVPRIDVEFGNLDDYVSAVGIGHDGAALSLAQSEAATHNVPHRPPRCPRNGEASSTQGGSSRHDGLPHHAAEWLEKNQWTWILARDDECQRSDRPAHGHVKETASGWTVAKVFSVARHD